MDKKKATIWLIIVEIIIFAIYVYPWYSFIEPRLFGIPFFYWWVIINYVIGSVIMLIYAIRTGEEVP